MNTSAPNDITPAEARLVEDTLARMSLEEKAGALLVARVVTGEGGELWEGREDQSAFGFAPTSDLLLERHISHITVMNPTAPDDLARWYDTIQELTAGMPSALPVSVAADPMHGREKNAQFAMSSSGFTTLPEAGGLAASRDADLVYDAAFMMGKELRAAGMHIALHPIADLGTEPRWPRVGGTFGADPELARSLTAAYIQGIQAAGMVATVKHFPGGGPQQRGEDAHFAAGAHTVFPGGRFEDHLAPFAAAVDAGVGRVMPGYSAPVGIDAEEIGYAFQRGLMTDLLRGRLGFDGIVLTDYNIVDGMRLPRMGIEFGARAWGVEHLDPVERVIRLFDAGVDQLGGEDNPRLILDAVERGGLSVERIDASVRRVLLEKVRLGLLSPTQGPEPLSPGIVRSESHRRLAARVQERSLVALQGAPLPLSRETRVYSEGVDPHAVAAFGRPVETLDEADVAVLRIGAPFEQREGLLESAFHSGSLEFPQETVDHIAAIAARVPTAVDVYLDRPAILTPLTELPVTIVGSFGVDDDILLAALAGATEVAGKLPFEIPRSMAEVEASREDVPFDTATPVFTHGHGLVWSSHEAQRGRGN